jgi:hypothetical protein
MAFGADPVVIGDAEHHITLHPPDAFRTHGLEHRIDVMAGPFRGSLLASCYAKPYRRFHEELSTLHETLLGEARLGPSYENLEVDFSGDGRGHIAVKVTVHADHVRPIRLEYRIYLDQTQLPKIIRQVEQAFILGVPPDDFEAR